MTRPLALLALALPLLLGGCLAPVWAGMAVYGLAKIAHDSVPHCEREPEGCR